MHTLAHVLCYFMPLALELNAFLAECHGDVIGAPLGPHGDVTRSGMVSFAQVTCMELLVHSSSWVGGRRITGSDDVTNSY